MRTTKGEPDQDELEEPTLTLTNVEADPVLKLALGALNRVESSDDGWEQPFAQAFMQSARIRRVTQALAFRFPVDSEDVQQQLVITMLQKLRDRDFELVAAYDFFALTSKIGERFCMANIQGAWDTRSLDLLQEQAAANGSHDPGDASDEGHSALEMERGASLQVSGTREKLRDYMRERHNPPELRQSKNKNRNIHLPPASDHVVTRQDGKTLTKTDTPVNYLNLRLTKVEALLKSSPGRPPGSTSGGAVEYRRNAEQQELFEYWQASGLSQENFAASIDVSLAAFKSYIYGKTKDVPPQVIVKAREYQSKTETLTEQLHKRFDFPMPVILARWEKALGLTEARDDDVATILGVNHTTVLRWRSDDTKPKVRDLARYELAVNAWAARTAESRKKASELTPRKPRSAAPVRAAAGKRVRASK